MKQFALLIALVMLLPCISFAHSGGTDENGGHYDSSTGSYHYHHGYPAHQHTDGICPYDYKDNVDRSKSSYKNDNYDSSPPIPSYSELIESYENPSISEDGFISRTIAFFKESEGLLDFAFRILFACMLIYFVFIMSGLLVSGIGQLTRITLIETVGEIISGIGMTFMMLPFAILYSIFYLPYRLILKITGNK